MNFQPNFKRFRGNHQAKLRRGLTLVEIMIASSIAMLVVVMVTQMSLSVGKILFDSTAKLQITRDVRVFTQQISRDAWSAREFRVYTSVDDLSRRGSGGTGDVLALVWAAPEPLEDATPGSDEVWYYERIVVYARAAPVRASNQRSNQSSNQSLQAENKIPVLRFERSFALPGDGVAGTKASDNTISLVVADMLEEANRDNETIVVELARGLADQRLFFHSRTGRSVTINGEIFHGNRARQVSNTYNSTISPRG